MVSQDNVSHALPTMTFSLTKFYSSRYNKQKNVNKIHKLKTDRDTTENTSRPKYQYWKYWCRKWSRISWIWLWK